MDGLGERGLLGSAFAFSHGVQGSETNWIVPMGARQGMEREAREREHNLGASPFFSNTT